jgi:hypothetical protein
MLAVAAFFMGQFALFTYLRPFLEAVTRVDVSTLSVILLVVGVAGLLGTYLISFLLRTRLYSLLVVMPLAMAAIAVGLITLGQSPMATAILLAGWGLIGTAAPVGWWTWLSRVLPDDAEAGGGLMVAVIQLAITAARRSADSCSIGAGIKAHTASAPRYSADPRSWPSWLGARSHRPARRPYSGPLDHSEKGAQPMDPNKTALVLIEFQNDFVKPGGAQHDAVKDVMVHYDA